MTTLEDGQLRLEFHRLAEALPVPPRPEIATLETGHGREGRTARAVAALLVVVAGVGALFWVDQRRHMTSAAAGRSCGASTTSATCVWKADGWDLVAYRSRQTITAGALHDHQAVSVVSRTAATERSFPAAIADIGPRRIVYGLRPRAATKVIVTTSSGTVHAAEVHDFDSLNIGAFRLEIPSSLAIRHIQFANALGDVLGATPEATPAGLEPVPADFVPRVELNEAGYAAITAEHTGAVTANGAP